MGRLALCEREKERATGGFRPVPGAGPPESHFSLKHKCVERDERSHRHQQSPADRLAVCRTRSREGRSTGNPFKRLEVVCQALRIPPTSSSARSQDSLHFINVGASLLPSPGRWGRPRGGGGGRKAHFPSLRPLRPGSPPAGRCWRRQSLMRRFPRQARGRAVGGGQAARRIPENAQATAVRPAAVTEGGSGSKENKLLPLPCRQPGAARPGRGPPPSPSSEGANVQTRPCHIKANLRHEKRLLKRVLPKRGLHSNPGVCVHDEQGSGPTTAPGCGACPGHRHMRDSLGPPRCSVTSGKPCAPCCPRGQRRPRVSWARWRSPAGGPRPQPPGQPSFRPGSDRLAPAPYL